MIWAIDLDGVITTNPDFFRWWIYQLTKQGNNNEIYIVSARNPKRRRETEFELSKWGIIYKDLITMLEGQDRNYTAQAEWKLRVIRDLKPDIWIDNEIKVYERVCGVKIRESLPNVNIINI